MEHNQQPSSQNIKRTKTHEGPRNHFLAFGISIALTVLAFVAAANPGLGKTFIYSFIIFLAIVQVIVQLMFWMHMKDRGHTYAKIFIGMGAFIVLTLVITARYWIWW